MAEAKLDLALIAGENLLGHFSPPGSEEDDPGVLRWTESGAELKLFSETSWPGEVGSPTGPVHGWVDGDEITLLEGWKKRRGIGTSHAITIRAGTLLRGGHFDRESKWSKILLRTANLHEWIPNTGISTDLSTDEDGRTERFQVEWSRPQSRTVGLKDARLTLAPCMETESEYSPGHSIRTDYECLVEVHEPASLAQLHRRFAQPLLCLLVLAADLPDALTRERVIAGEPGCTARILRSGDQVSSREWNPARPFLFYADDLPDMSSALQRWFELFERVPEALGNFAASVNEGNTYSPDRLLKVASAAEAYHREVHNKGGRLEQRLKQLRDLAGFSDQDSFSDRNLSLIAAGRHYHGHSGISGYSFSVEEIVDSGFPSIRRATALMQGCLMRELGFDAAQIEERFKEHYFNWPVP